VGERQAMRGISIKSLVVGNLVSVVVYLATLVVGVFITVPVEMVEQQTTNPDLSDDAHVLWLIGSALVASSMVAGYIAAQTAPNRRLIYGALSVSLFVLLPFYEIVGGPLPSAHHEHDLPPYIDFSLVAMSVFGMAGAFIQSRVNGTK
jgi:hypothetical protein